MLKSNAVQDTTLLYENLLMQRDNVANNYQHFGNTVFYSFEVLLSARRMFACISTVSKCLCCGGALAVTSSPSNWNLQIALVKLFVLHFTYAFLLVP